VSSTKIFFIPVFFNLATQTELTTVQPLYVLRLLYSSVHVHVTKYAKYRTRYSMIM